MLTGVYLVVLLWCFDSGLKKNVSWHASPSGIQGYAYDEILKNRLPSDTLWIYLGLVYSFSDEIETSLPLLINLDNKAFKVSTL